MKQQSDHAAEQAALYLQQMGLRPSTKGYLYLNFALTQLLQGTPFQNTVWELTAIHFDQKRENVMSCVRREIAHAFEYNSVWLEQKGINRMQGCATKLENVLHLAIHEIKRLTIS